MYTAHCYFHKAEMDFFFDENEHEKRNADCGSTNLCYDIVAETGSYPVPRLAAVIG